MQATPAARPPAPGLHTALAALRATLDAERRFDPSAASGSFTIGVTDWASAVMGLALAARLAATAPGIGTVAVAFLGLAPWTQHLLWSPFVRRDRAHARLRATVTEVCAGL